MNNQQIDQVPARSFFKIAFILLFFLFASSLSAQKYKQMMNDMRVNINDVKVEAEKYFANRDKTAKGSGWKGYQRWLFENEPKYYPSGDRSNVDPYFTANAFKAFRRNNPSPKSLHNAGWKDLGPYYIESVTHHYSVGLGRVDTFYIDPVDERRMYIGSRSGGFWKTLDGGNTWAGSSSDFLTATGINTMTVSPTNTNRILINLRNANNGITHGIYRSLDGGDSWTETNFNPQNIGWGGLGNYGYIHKITYHPTISNLVFIATSHGLFRSDNELASWTNPLTVPHFIDIAFHPTNPDIIYAANYEEPSLVYISTDRGVSFSSTSIAGNTSRIHLSTSADCSGCIFVGTSDGVWRSMNEGQSFIKIYCIKEL